MSKYGKILEEDPNSIAQKIMNRVFEGAEVLEFGCAEGRMTKYLHDEKKCSVSIVEIDQDSFSKAKEFAIDGLCSDIENDEWKEYYSGRLFDFIIFADVLEHLRNPEKVLESIKDYLKESGEVLISIPNIAFNDIIAKLYINRFDYTSTGLLDDTHVHFWGIENIKEIAMKNGYSILLIDGTYQYPFCTEQKIDARNIPNEIRVALLDHSFNDVYQVFFVLVKQKKDFTCEHPYEQMLLGSHPFITLFWNYGDGYKPENSMRLFPVSSNENIKKYVVDQIPEKCKKLRIDPVEGCGCALFNLHVYSKSFDYAVSPVNGKKVDNFFLFLDHDPNLEINVVNNDSAIFIEYEIIFLPDGSLRIISQLDELREEIKKQNGRTIKEKNELETELITISSRYNEVITSNCWKITKPIRIILDKLKKL